MLAGINGNIDLSFTGLFVGFEPAEPSYDWWNVTWEYRYKLDVEVSAYQRADWPVERVINFTDQLPSGTFDNNSIRVIEYNSSGYPIYEIPSQFVQDPAYDASNNAIGTLIFVMNGSLQVNNNRTIFVYYDVTENGAKTNPSYSTSLEFGTDGTEITVNNSIFNYRLDTLRGERSAGLFRVRGLSSSNDVLTYPLGAGELTYEYSQYSNGSHNFTFDFENDATFVETGPVRMVLEQTGNERLWDSTTDTNEGFMTKRYTFYENVGWIKVETNYTNLAASSINRNSSFAAATTLETARAFGSNWQSGFGNTTPPGWWYGSDLFSSFHAGIVQVNQSGTTNFWIRNSSGNVRIGAELNDTSLNQFDSIIEEVAFHFNDTNGDLTQVRLLRDNFAHPVNVTQSLPQELFVLIDPVLNATVFNRDEQILVTANISSGDPYNVTSQINATFDMGTGGAGDDQTLILYDDGTNQDAEVDDQVFTNVFNLSTSETTGTWTINYTTYSADDILINWTTQTFTLTDTINVTVGIINDKPTTGQQVVSDVAVTKFRGDQGIPGLTLGCNVLGQDVTNQTDLGIGNYSVNFTASGSTGTYELVCNATSTGNFGEGNDTYDLESATTAVNITQNPNVPQVSGVSQIEGDWFEISISSNNIGDGTAYIANVSTELLGGWTTNSSLEECGDIGISSSCIRGFNITVPAGTATGAYIINVTTTWRNPDNTTTLNRSNINVDVLDNPTIDIFQNNISGIGIEGWYVDLAGFNLLSVGSSEIQNITFSCVSGNLCQNFTVEGVPSLVTNVSVGANVTVSANVTSPVASPPGQYSGLLNASAENNGYENLTVYLTIENEANVSIRTDIATYISSAVTALNSDWFEFEGIGSTTSNSSARDANMSLELPSGWSSNVSLYSCGNMINQIANPDPRCFRGFNVTIPAGTTSGTYFVNVSMNWTDPVGGWDTNKSSINVTITSGPAINLPIDTVSANVQEGSITNITDFIISSVGNDPLTDIVYSCVSGTGEVCDNFTTTFDPVNITSLSSGSNQNVTTTLTVPSDFPSGLYAGTVNASSSNDGWDTVTLNITVAEDRSWTISQTICTASIQSTAGDVCEINVTNIGNAIINFTVSPQQGNQTEVNETFFQINGSDWRVFDINYNISGNPPDIYMTNFTVDAVHSDADPDNVTINVTLFPFLPPIINVTLTPDDTLQSSIIQIDANVTDQSNQGILFTGLNVTRPSGTVDQFNMSRASGSGNFSTWAFSYPNVTGTTAEIGTYNVTVFSRDNLGNIGNSTEQFVIHFNVSIVSTTLSTTYFQGDTGSIFFIARDSNSTPIENVSTNFTIRDPFNNITFQSSNYNTDSQGTISPFPSFTLSSDAIEGNYTLTAKSSFYDSVNAETLEFETNSSFEVFAETVSVNGLFADVETTVAWFPENLMKFAILVYDGEGTPIDPDHMNMTIKDPADDIYQTRNFSQMTQEATGLYTFDFAMPSGTAAGMYLAILDVNQGGFETTAIAAFRVTSGGPFDLRLFLDEPPEVVTGTSLDFQINIENKGEVTQDVFLDYFVTQGTSNESLSQFSEAILAPAGSNQTFSRNIFIFSSIQPGTYLLNARMAFSQEFAPILVNKTFVVLGSAPNTTTTTTSGGSSGGGGTTDVQGAGTIQTLKIPENILITSYDSDVKVARGFATIENVIVSNIGSLTLNDVRMSILGIEDEGWYNVSPSSYREIGSGNSSVFIVTWEVPESAALGSYPGTLLATSGDVSDQKDFTLTIVDSIEELLREEIADLREQIEDLKVDMRVAQIQGFDISVVELLVEQAEEELDEAEENLDRGRVDEAIGNVRKAKNLINKSRNILDGFGINDVSLLPLLPFFNIVAIVGAVLGSSFGIIFVLYRKKKLPERMRPWILHIVKLTETMKPKVKAPSVDAVKESEKLTRMLEVLEKERKENIISIGAYNEMKRSIQKKIIKLKK